MRPALQVAALVTLCGVAAALATEPEDDALPV
jgi:hypothetical protein